MALTTCKECGGQLSTRAKACPHCGKPGRFPVALLGVYAVMIVIILSAGFYYVNLLMGHIPG